jgi:hypothetical protein
MAAAPSATSLRPQPAPNQKALDQTGFAFAELWKLYLKDLDVTARTAQWGPLVNAANDAAAATAGVPVNGLYRNGNAVQVRLV